MPRGGSTGPRHRRGPRAFRFAMGAAVSDFLAAYPDYAATARLDELRATEYSYLDSGGHI